MDPPTIFVDFCHSTVFSSVGSAGQNAVCCMSEPLSGC